MTVDINRIVANPFGRTAYQLARPFVNFMRRRAHPDIPTNHTITTVQCGDRKFAMEHRRWSDDDVLAIKQCFELRQYDMPVGRQGAIIQKFHDEIIASGRQPLIVDCGANIGASVLWFATRYPRAHIVAIEPAPQNFTLLQKNTAGLDVDHHLAGIASEDGQAFLKDRGGEMGFQTISSTEGSSVPMLPVKMISIATLLADKSPSRYTPFILKIDIEGAEQGLFSGDTSCYDLFPLILMEPHDWMLPGQLTSQPFFRYHATAGREFAMKDEIVASIAVPSATNGAVAAI